MKSGLNSDTVLSAAAESDWSAAPLSALIAHIVSVHHRCLRLELPRIQRLLEAVYATHRGTERRHSGSVAWNILSVDGRTPTPYAQGGVRAISSHRRIGNKRRNEGTFRHSLWESWPIQSLGCSRNTRAWAHRWNRLAGSPGITSFLPMRASRIRRFSRASKRWNATSIRTFI